MAFNPITDLAALLRSTTGGLRSVRIPGLDYILSALARMNFVSLSVGATPPVVNQASTAWLVPAAPSWSAEGVVMLWNATAGQYQPATPALWSALIAGPFISLIPVAGNDAPQMDGIASAGVSPLYSREDHVHPTDTTRAAVNSPAFTGTPTAVTASLGTSTTQLATTAFVIANGGLPPPIGSILAYAGTSAPSANWTILDGKAVSRTGATATLFSILGITFGSGDGVTTFNVPDLRGRTIAGVDGGVNRLTTATMSSQALAGVGGAETQTLTLAQIPTGLTSAPGTPWAVSESSGDNVPHTTGNVSNGTATSGSLSVGQSSAGAWGNASFTATGSVTSNNTSGQAHINVQPTMEFNWIMRVS